MDYFYFGVNVEAIINFLRLGKGVVRYIEGLVDDDGVRLKTQTFLPSEFSRSWCEENWWMNGYDQEGNLVGRP